jgi:hypothetical protein
MGLIMPRIFLPPSKEIIVALTIMGVPSETGVKMLRLKKPVCFVLVRE